MTTWCSLFYPERPLHPFSTIDLFPFCFHAVTKPSSSNSCLFTSIQNAGGGGSPHLAFSNFELRFSILGVSPLESAFTPNPPASPLDAAFTKTNRGWGSSSTGTPACAPTKTTHVRPTIIVGPLPQQNEHLDVGTRRSSDVGTTFSFCPILSARRGRETHSFRRGRGRRRGRLA